LWLDFRLFLGSFFSLEHTGHNRTLSRSFSLRFFLALDTECGPGYGHQAFFVDIFTTPDALTVLTSVHTLQRFLNGLQSLEIAFMQVV
jgi:hypothetical protein